VLFAICHWDLLQDETTANKIVTARSTEPLNITDRRDHDRKNKISEMLIVILISRLGGTGVIEQLNGKAIQLTVWQGRTFPEANFPRVCQTIDARLWSSPVAIPPQKFTRLHMFSTD
jgi:hypothetical protein